MTEHQELCEMRKRQDPKNPVAGKGERMLYSIFLFFKFNFIKIFSCVHFMYIFEDVIFEIFNI